MCAQNRAATIPLLTPNEMKLLRPSRLSMRKTADSTNAHVFSEAPNTSRGNHTLLPEIQIQIERSAGGGRPGGERLQLLVVRGKLTGTVGWPNLPGELHRTCPVERHADEQHRPALAANQRG